MGKVRGWSEQQQGHHFASDDADGPGTPEYAPYGPASPHEAPPSPGSPSSTFHTSSSSAFAVASSLLQRVPGAKRISYFNAALLTLFGLAAAAAAWGGGCAMLLVLLARWYLPARETHISLPLHFDYAAGPSAAGAWLPLLRPTPITASLTPPPQQLSLAAAGLSVQGNLAPGSSLSFSSGGNGFGSSQGGFLGLGLGPGSRAVAQGGAGGWFWRSGSKGRRGKAGKSGKQRRGSGSGSSSSGRGGFVDVGSGVLVPESDWLVPLRGRMGLEVMLEVPGWPEADLVQVTSELVSQQGIVLGRSTRTWVPKPRPLAHRLVDLLIYGPWRALGLVDGTIRVQLPMFEGFQNPQPPPDGWGSVPGLKPATAKGSADQAACGTGAAGTKSGAVPEDYESSHDDLAGPRVTWLRVTLIGRSVGYGPPKVYRAAARVDMKLSLFDRLATTLRPSLATCLLLIITGLGLTVGGAGTAAVLLLLAYALYSWGSSITTHPNARDSALKGSAKHGRVPAGDDGVFEGLGFADPLEDRPGFDAGFEVSSGPTPRLSGEEQYDGRVSHDAAGVQGEQAADSDSLAASMDETFDAFQDASEFGINQQQQQQQQSVEMQPVNHHHAGSSQQQQQQEGSGGSGAVFAIRRMLGFGQQQQGGLSGASAAAGGSRRGWGGAAAALSATGGAGAGGDEIDSASEEELMHDVGISGLPADADDEWKDELLADSEDGEWQQQQQYAAAAAAKGAGSSNATAAASEEASALTGGPSRRLGYQFKG